MSDPFPALECIEFPNGAQAAATQMMAPSRVQYPRGFRDRSQYAVSIPVPHRDAAMWFKQVHAGYMGAQFIGYATTPSQLLHLFSSEGTELACASTWDPAAKCGYEGTLKPRRLAVWVQLSSGTANMESGERMLNAVSKWSQFVTPKGDKIANVVRISVAACDDANNFKRRTDIQSVRPPRPDTHWVCRVSIRWVDKSGIERTETEQFLNAPATADGALALVQQTVVRLSGAHDAPLHVATMVPVTERVPVSCFATTVATLHTAFQELVTSKPHCSFDAAAGHPESAPLENTGVVVRICERQLGEKGMASDTAFHGALLSFGASKGDALAFAKAAADSADGTLGAPIGMQEASMALHVCAVHAEKRLLGTLVTLYGSLGKCGQPIHDRGGTWVWVESAAIRPVDSDLLKHFCVYPCTKASIMPSNAAFHEAYRTHFSRASDLYANLDMHRPKREDSFNSLSTVEAGIMTEHLDCLPPRPNSPMTKEEKATERQVLASLRVGLESKRTTIGEACAYLMEYDPPSEVVKMLMISAGKLGVGASLHSMVQLCYKSIQACVVSADVVEENTRLKRLADIALAAHVTDLDDVLQPGEKRQKRDPLVVATERVRRTLKVCGRKAGLHATIHRTSPTDYGAVLEAVCKMIGCRNAPIAASTALGTLQKITPEHDAYYWEGLVMRALAKIIDVTLRNAGMVNLAAWTSIFVLSSRVGAATTGVFVERLTVDGNLATSTFDDMITVAEPRVLIVNYLDKGQVRVTSTVPL